VGATKLIPIPYNTAVAVPDVAYVGFVYQWGRNVGFDLGTLSTWEKQLGPVTLEQAEAGGVYADKYITVTSTTSATDNWIADLTLNPWAESAQGPCPEGWIVPDINLYVPLINEYNANIATYVIPNASTAAGTLRVIRFPGDGNTGYLYLPCGGYSVQNGTNAQLTNNGVYSSFWTTNAGTTNKAKFAYMKANGTTTVTPDNQEVQRYWALPIRCIQQ
jgi:uncharacterized protein (TIGR02145 family)